MAQAVLHRQSSDGSGDTGNTSVAGRRQANTNTRGKTVTKRSLN